MTSQQRTRTCCLGHPPFCLQLNNYKTGFICITGLMFVHLFLMYILVSDEHFFKLPAAGGLIYKLGLGSERARALPVEKWLILDTSSGDCSASVRVPPGWRVLRTREMLLTDGLCASHHCKSFSRLLLSTRNDTSDVNSAQLKNLAYLFAISNRALCILDADCSVDLDEVVRLLQAKVKEEHGVLYNETLLFNPYAHFGAWSKVPRAVGKQQTINNSRVYYVRDFPTVLVKHGLAENSKDAINYTHKASHFDPSTPPVFVGQRTFSPAVPASSVYQQGAFWALLLPCMSSSLRCSLSRLFIMQRLFRELDVFSGFHALSSSSSVEEKEGSDSAKGMDVERFASELDSWKCKAGLQFFSCIEEVADMLLGKHYLVEHEHQLIKLWVQVLKQLKVTEPVRVKIPWRGIRRTTEFKVTLGRLPERLESKGSEEEKFLESSLVKPIQDTCPNGSSPHLLRRSIGRWKTPVFTDIVLIIFLKSSVEFWKNLPFMETIHRPYFKHIFYCIPSVDDLMRNDRNKVLLHVNLVEGMENPWCLMYKCIIAVTEVNTQKVSGYLYIGDDTMVNTWNLPNLSKNSFWKYDGDLILSIQKFKHKWFWWARNFNGLFNVLKGMSAMERFSGMTRRELLDLNSHFNSTNPSALKVVQKEVPKSARREGVFWDLRSKLKPVFSQMQVMSSHQLKHLDPDLLETWTSHRPLATFSDMLTEAISVHLNTTPKVQPHAPKSWGQLSREDARRFLKNYYVSSNMAGLVHPQTMDFWHVPQAKVQDFRRFARFFLSHGVFAELLDPLIEFGLSSVPSDIAWVPHGLTWGGQRNSMLQMYDNTSGVYLHPFKWRSYMGRPQFRHFFCTRYLKDLMSNLP